MIKYLQKNKFILSPKGNTLNDLGLGVSRKKHPAPNKEANLKKAIINSSQQSIIINQIQSQVMRKMGIHLHIETSLLST